jgi:DNA-binding MarR family transcriptional regulator
LLRRRRHTGDRRSVVVTATAAGHAVVDAVRRRRRADLAALLGGIPAGRRAQLVKALQALSPNALDDEDADWSIGWTT